MPHSSALTKTTNWLDRCRLYGGWISITAWATSLSIVTSALMVAHWITLPKPEPGSSISPSLLTHVSSDDRRLRVVHVNYLECPCSRRVVRHLIRREPLPDAIEKLLLVGEDQELQVLARSQGYAVESVTREELQSRFGLQSSPLMMVFDSESNLIYSGGYTSRKQGPAFQDETIIKALIDGESVESLPVFGCAVSKDLQQLVDPLQLKYQSN
ncbi:hypothetical protein [Roseiconus lacunae]|uniref:hypothetical protein n=1 Tax=Roseiconus lacunae TaxID=2605694 RepID=UPI001E35CF53|nr:hypothetical protein [Roseiconus lacunae]MCD0461079.1 hypothetical protein [Roseiconus lacunae]